MQSCEDGNFVSRTIGNIYFFFFYSVASPTGLMENLSNASIVDSANLFRLSDFLEPRDVSSTGA